MKKIILSLLCGGSVFAAQLDAKFVRAVHLVESGGRVGKIMGDNGRALGPLQIHKEYWKDAVSFDKSIGGSYSDCADLNYSIKIVTAYLNRYAKNAVANNDYESLARCHNSGPLWSKNKSKTNSYWNKIKKHL